MTMSVEHSQLFLQAKDAINELKAFSSTQNHFSYKGEDVKTHEYHEINEIKKLSDKYVDDDIYFHSNCITRNGRYRLG